MQVVLLAVAAALLGLTAGLALRWAVAHERWHEGCRRCPWTPFEAPTAPVEPVVPVSLHWAHGGFPVLQVGALDRPGSQKGGP